MSARPAGRVYLVGAGPGDPKLLTLRAAEVLGACDVVLVDRLVNRAVLAHVREGAEVVDVGKRAGDHVKGQAEINALLVAHAREGRVVVRLKGGDPFVFGRGGEEALALVEAGIAWEVVPGVSAGIAAAAYAGIPVTHRGVASRVTFQTAHREAGARDGSGDDETLVLFMCGATLRDTARELIANGRATGTPVAIVRSGTWEDEQVDVGTLGEMARTELEAGDAPVLAIVGEVVALRERLGGWRGRTEPPISAPLRSSLRRTPARP